MKKTLALLSCAVMAVSCGGALDGDPTTDTTTMPVDTNLHKTTVNHTNENYGTTPADTSKIDSVPPGNARNGLPSLEGNGRAGKNGDGN